MNELVEKEYVVLMRKWDGTGTEVDDVKVYEYGLTLTEAEQEVSVKRQAQKAIGATEAMLDKIQYMSHDEFAGIFGVEPEEIDDDMMDEYEGPEEEEEEEEHGFDVQIGDEVKVLINGCSSYVGKVVAVTDKVLHLLDYEQDEEKKKYGHFGRLQIAFSNIVVLRIHTRDGKEYN